MIEEIKALKEALRIAEARVEHLEGREAAFIRALDDAGYRPADGGRYRADVASAVAHMADDLAVLRAQNDAVFPWDQHHRAAVSIGEDVLRMTESGAGPDALALLCNAIGAAMEAPLPGMVQALRQRAAHLGLLHEVDVASRRANSPAEARRLFHADQAAAHHAKRKKVL